MFFTTTFIIVHKYPCKNQVTFLLPVTTAFSVIPYLTLIEQRAGYVLKGTVKEVGNIKK